ncbi:hypothetical protein BGZ98_005565 [Dissophora globulifera]|nr:hypothetical protein BGZ98_005565 [Dissophora globulifera]
MRSSARGWMVQALAEFVGTAMFLYVAVGGADSVSDGLGYSASGSILARSFAFGFSLIFVSWSFFRISGSHFNPALSLSSCITGHISVMKFILYSFAQVVGGMLGVALARGTTPSSASIEQTNQLFYGESIARGFFLEFFLTAILCFVYHMTVHEKNRSTFMAALPYGITLFSCHLFATRYTNAAINPAQAFAVSIVARSFAERIFFIFIFGPLTGGIFAAGLHILFKFLDYDKYNAGIDADNLVQYRRAQDALDGHYGHHGHHGAPVAGAGPGTTPATTVGHDGLPR